MRKKKAEPIEFNEKDLQDELTRSAKAAGISAGSAEAIACKVAKNVTEHIGKRAIVTADDLNRFIASEAEKYNKDLAYLYKNHGKII